jgi:hypothetical protein
VLFGSDQAGQFAEVDVVTELDPQAATRGGDAGRARPNTVF